MVSLKAVFVFVDQALDFEEVILLEGIENFLDVVPHLGFDLSAAVAQGEREIGLARLFRFYLLGDYNKGGGDDFIFVIGRNRIGRILS